MNTTLEPSAGTPAGRWAHTAVGTAGGFAATVAAYAAMHTALGAARANTTANTALAVAAMMTFSLTVSAVTGDRYTTRLFTPAAGALFAVNYVVLLGAQDALAQIAANRYAVPAVAAFIVTVAASYATERLTGPRGTR